MFEKGNRWRFKKGHKWRFKKGHKGYIGNWKGEDAKYRAIHLWVERHKGLPTTCEKCGRTNLHRQQIDWANIDHKYRRNLDDYIRICRKCHMKYDKIKLKIVNHSEAVEEIFDTLRLAGI